MPKIVDKESKRREIAAHAISLFAQQGFENTPVREITARAGIGKGTLYDYFKNKEEILGEIVQLIFREWNTLIQNKIADRDDPLDQLRFLLEEGVALGERFEQAMIMYVDLWRRTVSKKGSDEFTQNFQAYLMDAKANVCQIVKSAQHEGLIKADIDPHQLAFALVSLIDGICLHAMILKDKIDTKSMSTAIFEMLLTGIAP